MTTYVGLKVCPATTPDKDATGSLPLDPQVWLVVSKEVIVTAFAVMLPVTVGVTKV